MTISAVIIARDDEGMMRPCLERLSFVDEIVVVVDSRSEDETERVAREFTEKVYVREFDNFSGQRNYAIEQARGEWILVVDTDERVTPALARRIQHAVDSPGAFVGFSIPEAHFGFGKQLRGGGWRSVPPRLNRRENLLYHGDIDEAPELVGPTGMLSGELWHFSHTDMRTMLKKLSLDGPVSAQQMLDTGASTVTVTSLVTAPIGEFFTRMVKLHGFQDGIEGVIEAMFMAFAVFCIRVMMWEKQRQQPLEETYARLEQKARQERPERVRGRFIA